MIPIICKLIGTKHFLQVRSQYYSLMSRLPRIISYDPNLSLLPNIGVYFN